jgi:L-ascorbate metabolism protein UlaG (beta-lactamase superfamily)
MSNFKTDQITVNTQSSIRIESAEGTVIYLDPLEIEGNPQDADLILVTHSHYDHFSPADIAKIRKGSTKLVVPSSMKGDMEKNGFDLRDYLCMEEEDMISAAGICIKAVPAYNKLKPFHPRRNGWIGYVLIVDGAKIYVAGDTDALKENTSIECDIAMIGFCLVWHQFYYLCMLVYRQTFCDCI